MEFNLRPWTMNDLDSLCKHANNPNVKKYMSDEFPDNKNKWKSWIEFASTNKTILYRAIEINGEAAGGIGINLQKDQDRKNAELGYWISEDYWGLGIMTRAIIEMVKISFDEFGINRIFATPFENNVASHRVLEKAGFILETGSGSRVKNSKQLNESVYAIKRNE